VLAVGPDHAVHLVAQLDSGSVGYSWKQGTAANSEWDSTLETVASGSEPSIAVSGYNIAHVVYVSTGDIFHSYRYLHPRTFLNGEPEQDWQDEEEISTGSSNATPDIAAGPFGEAHAVWEQGGTIYARTRLNHGTGGSPLGWGTIATLGSGEHPAIAVQSDGDAYAIWQNGSSLNYAVKTHQGSWSSASSITTGTTLATEAEPDIAVDARDDVWAVYVENNNEVAYWDFTAAQRMPVSKTGPELSVHPRVAGATVEGGDENGPHIVWADKDGNEMEPNCGGHANPPEDVCYRNRDGLYDDAKTQGNISNSSAVSDYPSIAQYEDGVIHVAWQEQSGSMWRVYYSSFEPSEADGDSIPDPYEDSTDYSCLSSAGKDNADDDGDLLSNFEEYYYTGSDPCDEDTDGDGAPDGAEAGNSFADCGQRSPTTPHDFYDVNQDGVIDLVNDILGVILHYSPGGGPPYDVDFDRAPQTGPNNWNRSGRDGVIDLPNDILGVIVQYSPGECPS